MKSYSMRLVTIVTEAALERELIERLESLGASGYTITDARGKGRHGVRNSSWENASNIRIEVLCGAEMADTLAADLQARYYDHYGMILFVSQIEVLRPEKFQP